MTSRKCSAIGARISLLETLEFAEESVSASVLLLLQQIDSDRRNFIFYRGDEPYDVVTVAVAIDAGFLVEIPDNDLLDAGERFAYKLTGKGREAIGLPARRPFWLRLLPF